MGLTRLAPPVCEEAPAAPAIDHVAAAYRWLEAALPVPHRWRGLLHVDFKRAKELAKQRQSGGDHNQQDYSFNPSDDKRVRTWLWPSSSDTVPNVVSSLWLPPDRDSFPTLSDETWHYPVLDLDFPDITQEHYERLDKHFPCWTHGWVSSTHHWHLYVNWRIRWGEYRDILHDLAEAEVLERGYVNASVERGYTALRLPWFKKEDGE